MYSKTIVVGRAAAPPELKYTKTGVAVATVSVAEDRGRDTTVWWRVSFWREAAESAAQHIGKGDAIVIDGQAKAHAWIGDDGNARAQLELSAFTWRFAGGGKRDDNERTPDDNAQEPEDMPF